MKNPKVLFGLLGVVVLFTMLSCGPLSEDSTTTEDANEGKHSSKKGIALGTGNKNKDFWKDKVQSLHVSWHYSWTYTLNGTEVEGVEFVPMFWGQERGNPEKWADKWERLEAKSQELTIPESRKGEESILGWNEPDNPNQSNITVADAIKGWDYLMNTNRRIGSPATVHGDHEWMVDFMKEVDEKKLQVDFVAIHWYKGPDVEKLRTDLEKFHALYNRPIWITEFAVAKWGTETAEDIPYTPEDVLNFMKEALPLLDTLDYVERYAWFTPDDFTHKNLAPSSLFNEQGKITELGKFYASH